MRRNSCLLPVLVLIFASGFTTARSTRATQSKDRQVPRRQEFGSSLKNLEWDPQKRRAAEKGEPPEVESGKAQSETAFRLQTTLAVFPVSVAAPNGRPVLGLQKEDFVVLENGVSQQVALFTLGDDAHRPRSIVLLLEWSNTAHTVGDSMKAAESFVGQLRPEDRVAIVTGNLKLICDFTSDKSELISKLRGLQEQARHGPNRLPAEQLEFETLFAVLQELIDQESDQPIIIFQGDGGEAAYLRDQFDADHPRSPSKKRQIGLADFDALIEKKYATIYPVLTWYYCYNNEMSDEEHARMIRRFYHEHGWWLILGVGYGVKSERASGQAINRVAQVSGGSVYCLETPLHRKTLWPQRRADDSADVSQRASMIYSQILSKINQRYVIGYYPTNQVRDGKRRKVEIQVRNHPEYLIESRRYYYAPTETSAQK